MRDYEEVRLYVEAGKKYGFTPCFFRLSDLRSHRSTVTAIICRNNDFSRQSVAVPRIIHNRIILSTNRMNRRLAALLPGNSQLFNRRNRYGKLYIHRLLMGKTDLQPHLPETRKATPRAVMQMMKKYDSLIIKPNNSSIGRGIMKIDRTNAGWKLTYPSLLSRNNRKWRTVEWKGTRLPSVLRSRIRRSFHIVQKRLPLATYQGRPFDLRVSVQRAGDGNWNITGIVAKVAPENAFVTNVAQGGKTRQLHTILYNDYPHLSYQEVVANINRLSLNIASYLSKKLPHLADLGLDIAITADGFPMFIECNGKDQRYSFRDAGMLREWTATYENPMAYAKYLLDARN
ncbi:YheC/YheD family protein [Paenibacillus harenae]|uniref:YheC/YheD family endospore coat-associated protein n=1 Tax=Paenibacillus harenae TaxID=306543 RepID=UPI00146B1C8F|nr:YheC/YheD family protein [Paenibacillus harenae]